MIGMRKFMASKTFTWLEKAKEGLKWLQKYFFLVCLATCTILRKC